MRRILTFRLIWGLSANTLNDLFWHSILKFRINYLKTGISRIYIFNCVLRIHCYSSLNSFIFTLQSTFPHVMLIVIDIDMGKAKSCLFYLKSISDTGLIVFGISPLQNDTHMLWVKNLNKDDTLLFSPDCYHPLVFPVVSLYLPRWSCCNDFHSPLRCFQTPPGLAEYWPPSPSQCRSGRFSSCFNQNRPNLLSTLCN